MQTGDYQRMMLGWMLCDKRSVLDHKCRSPSHLCLACAKGKLQCLRKSGCLDNLLDFVDEIASRLPGSLHASHGEDPSLFVQLQGKQRTKYKKMVQEFGGMQMTQDKLETLLEEVDRALEKFIPDGTPVKLFKIIQKVVFEVQLKMMYGCPLPEGVTLDR